MSILNPSTDDQRPSLKPPRFGLLTMFFIITVVCAMLVAMRAVGPLGSGALLLLAAAVFAHVAGNAIGCRLRANGSVKTRGEGLEASARRSTVYAASFSYLGPATSLRDRKRLGRSMMVLTLLGAIIGAVCGGSLLASLNWQRATVTNVSIGATSFAVLGGLWGFWASSFLRVFWSALSQAHRNSRQ